MKYLSKITLGLILCMGFITSCKDDDEPAIAGGIAVDKEEITIGPEGGTESVAVSSYSNWVASASKPWIAVSPANGIGSADCTLAIDSTLENTSRTSQVRFSLDGQEPKVITITQFGFGKQILLKESEIEIENSAEYDKRYFDVTISTNVNFKIDEDIVYSFAEEESMTEEEKNEVESESKDWLTMPKDSELEVNLDRKARPRTIKARFRWEMNTAPYTRIAKIKLVPENPEEDQLVDNDGNPIESVLLTVTQKPALKIEDNRSGDSLAIVTINEKIQSMITFDTSESMQNWGYVTLWEATDENVPDGAVGRVRSLQLMMFDLKDGETLPKEIRYLKYLESFTIQNNTNRQTRTVSLGEEICDLEYLKNLSVISYGMNKLPDNFINLGDKLETLNLGSNNFTSLADIMEVVNETNFPKLHSLTLTGCRLTDSYYDLSQGDTYNGKPLGLHFNFNEDTTEKEAFLKLLTWDNLRSLQLSYNFIEGELPDDNEVDAALTAAGKRIRYDERDFSTDEGDYLDKLVGDTCIWLNTNDNPVTVTYVDGTSDTVTGKNIPRVLPKAREFYINLNFLTGPLPKWILFHPHFVEWYPEGMVFNQQEDGRNWVNEKVGFNNINADKFDYSYYYGSTAPGSSIVVAGVAYPLYYYRYVANASTTK